MLKIVFILLFVLLQYLFRPSVSLAQTISDIDDIKAGESKPVTISGLELNKDYYWEEDRGTTKIYSDCFNSGTGEITRNIGPFNRPSDRPGKHTLLITESYVGRCLPVTGSPVISKDFNVLGAGPTISTIGDLNIGEVKDITVSRLTPNKPYVWIEKRKAIRDYKEEYKECDISDSNGVINRPLGPFNQSQVGIYKLEIYLRQNARVCEQPLLVSSVVSQDFSVGGATGTSCCVAPFGGYNPIKDECAKIVGAGQLSPTDRQPTECSKTGTFCDPSSLQCFKSKPPPVPGLPKPAGSPASSFGDWAKCNDDPKDPGIRTAIGCIHTSPVGFIKDSLKFILGISGGLAFLMMLLGAFQMLTSAGNPETLNAGKDRLTNAVIGLLFVIFSILLLQIIGVDILGIPGFREPI